MHLANLRTGMQFMFSLRIPSLCPISLEMSDTPEKIHRPRNRIPRPDSTRKCYLTCPDPGSIQSGQVHWNTGFWGTLQVLNRQS